MTPTRQPPRPADLRAIRRRLYRNYGSRKRYVQGSFEEARADVKALLAEVNRLDRRLTALQARLATEHGGTTAERGAAFLAMRSYVSPATMRARRRAAIERAAARGAAEPEAA